jgi:hypothetical protein
MSLKFWPGGFVALEHPRTIFQENDEGSQPDPGQAVLGTNQDSVEETASLKGSQTSRCPYKKSGIAFRTEPQLQY